MNAINVARAGAITDAPKLTDVGLNVLSFLLSTVGVVALLMILISGIVYFFAGGDNKKIQFAKKSANGWAIGLAMAFGGYVVVKFIGSFF